jgi:hypothetical protein
MKVSWQLNSPGALPPWERAFGNHWIGDWVSPETIWRRWRREKFPAPLGNRTKSWTTPFYALINTSFTAIPPIDDAIENASLNTPNSGINHWVIRPMVDILLCSGKLLSWLWYSILFEKPKIPHRHQKSPQLSLVLVQFNSFHITMTYFSEIHFNIINRLRFSLSMKF